MTEVRIESKGFFKSFKIGIDVRRNKAEKQGK